MAAFLREQGDAQRLFDQLHLMADSGVGEAQFVRRLANALVAGCRLKAAQGL